MTNQQLDSVICSILCNEPRHDDGNLLVHWSVMSKYAIAGYLSDAGLPDTDRNIDRVRKYNR